jgi:hypothetical protein
VTQVRIGQLWADRDAREVRAGNRQRLRVVGLDQFGPRESWAVHLNNEDTGVDSWVKRSRIEKALRLRIFPGDVGRGLTPALPQA